MRKKLLIVGAAGLIGSACYRLFLKENKYDLLIPSRKELDLFNSSQVNAYFKNNQPDYVILAAGLVGGIHSNASYPVDFITCNLRIQLNAFAAAHEVGVKQCIFFASSCMYPKICDQPMDEELLLTGSLEPTSLSYAIAKLAGLQMARAYNQQYQADRFVVLIPNSVYGPNDNFSPHEGHVLSALLARFHQAKLENRSEIKLWGTGEARREFIFADDLAAAVGCLIDRADIPLPLNIGVGYDISIKDLAKLIADTVGFQGEIQWDTNQPNGTMQKSLSSRKIANTGWKPMMPLKEGIELTYQWYLNKEAHECCEVSV